MSIKMSDVRKANEILDAIRDIKYQTGMIRAGHGLGITIQSTYQGEDFVNAIRPHVVAHMEKGLETLYSRLKELGVDCDPEPEEEEEEE